MYPIEIKKHNYNISIIDLISDIIDFAVFSIKSLKSTKELMIYLEKNFHF